MNQQANQDAGINGNPATLLAERAINELRRGRVIALTTPSKSPQCGDASSHCTLILSVETASAEAFSKLHALAFASNKHRSLVMATSSRRAQALSLNVGERENLELDQAVAVRLERSISLSTLQIYAGIAGAAPIAAEPKFETAHSNDSLHAAVTLTRHAQLLPTVIAVAVTSDELDDSLLCLGSEQVEIFQNRKRANSDDARLERIASARVPIRDEEQCEIVLFRDVSVDIEHLAIIIGDIGDLDCVPVRIHSACLTGDVLGSLRCDCGDQLRGAVQRMSARGGGVLLYLQQEGRGIGLANKLRAYSLQDTGFDTYDADEYLGFGVDDRSFSEAAQILQALNILRIQLLTNNPRKARVLASKGIEVVEQETLAGEANSHNEGYLNAKVVRAGHHIDVVGKKS